MKKDKSRITHLNNTYTEEENEKAKQDYRKRRAFKRRMAFIVGIGVFLIIVASIPLIRNMYHVHSLEQEQEVAVGELEELENHQEELNYYINLLNDEEYVAKLARSEYYITRDDEIVFSLPEDETSDHQEVIEEEEQEEQKEEQEEKSNETETK